MTDLQILASNIKRYRLFKGMTQTELASKIGMSPQYFSKIETARTGNLGLKYMIAICRELDIEVFQLFMEDSEVHVKFVVSNQNLESMERLIGEISKRVDIRFKQDLGGSKCREKRGDKK